MLKVGIGRPVPTFSLSLPDEAATERLGAALAERLRPRDVVALQGGLGAGKTTLARAILRAASGDPALIVPSPTFTLVEVYDTPRGRLLAFRPLPPGGARAGLRAGLGGGAGRRHRAGRMGGAAGPAAAHERLTVTLSIEGDGRRADLQGDARFGDV